MIKMIVFDSLTANLEHTEARTDLQLDATVPWQPSELRGGASLCLALSGPLQYHTHTHHALDGRVVHEGRTARSNQTLKDFRCGSRSQGPVHVVECHAICIRD